MQGDHEHKHPHTHEVNSHSYNHTGETNHEAMTMIILHINTKDTIIVINCSISPRINIAGMKM
jgi:hypothetical protein